MEKFFLNFDDPNFSDNFKSASKIFRDVQCVNSKESIVVSHKLCSKKSFTGQFMVIDSDNIILEHNINLKSIIDKCSNKNSIHIFRAKNPVNNLVYGHGGVKVFSKHFFDKDINGIDMSTSFSVTIQPDILSIHSFNSTPFHAWRTAFRECVKLSSASIKNRIAEDDDHRLTTWCEKFNNIHNAEFVKLGALAGRSYGFEGINLSAINDFKWLKEKFKETTNVLET